MAEISQSVERNVEAIRKLERAAIERQTFGERVSIAIARVCGSVTFVLLQLAGIAVWLALNRTASPYQFDPYPYPLLVMLVAIESLVLSTFVLTVQNVMSRHADRRAHLTLQIDILAESEMTKALGLLAEIRNHLKDDGEEDDEELRDLAQPTEVEAVARVLEDSIPDQTRPPTTGEV